MGENRCLWKLEGLYVECVSSMLFDRYGWTKRFMVKC